MTKKNANHSRVVLFCSSLNYLGGLSQHMSRIYFGFTQQGHTVDIIYSSSDQQNLNKYLLEQGIPQERLHHFLLQPRLLFLPFIFQVRSFLRKNNIEVIHSFMLHSDILAFFSSIFLKRIRRISSVEGQFLLDKKYGVGLCKQKVYGFLNKLIRGRFSKTVTVSEELRQQVINEGANAQKVLTIPIGINIPDEREIFKKQDMNLNAIGVMSLLSEDKGVQYIIRAMPLIKEQIPDIKLIIGGEGPYKNTLIELVKELKIQEIVSFKGWINDKVDFFRHCDVFVMTSAREGCPIALLEAWAYIKPIVAFDVPGINELIEQNKTGVLVEAFNVEKLAATIVELLMDEIKLFQIAEFGRKKVEESFGLENEINQFMKIY